MAGWGAGPGVYNISGRPGVLSAAKALSGKGRVGGRQYKRDQNGDICKNNKQTRTGPNNSPPRLVVCARGEREPDPSLATSKCSRNPGGETTG